MSEDHTYHCTYPMASGSLIVWHLTVTYTVNPEKIKNIKVWDPEVIKERDATMLETFLLLGWLGENHGEEMNRLAGVDDEPKEDPDATV